MARHTHSGEYAGRPGRRTHRTRVTQTVVLAVSLAAYTLKVVTVNYALETFTFRSTDDIHELHVIADDVRDGNGVAQFQLSREVGLELYELLLRSGSCLFKVPHKRRAGVLFCSFVIGKLHGGITIIFYRANLCDNARTSLNNSAWYVLTLGTENGSHSDFLSN